MLGTLAAGGLSVKAHSFLGLTTQGFHRVAYTEWGQPNAEPVVVCVHGLSRNGRDFDHLAGALQSHRRVICPDLVGRGQSDWLTDTQLYSFITYCADLTALLARLDSPAVDWVGTSMGGLLGMIMAAQKNSPIRRLVINDAGPLVPKAASQRILSYLGLAPPFPALEDAEQYVRRVFAPYGPLTGDQWAQFTRNSVRRSADGAYQMAYDPGIAEPMKASPVQDWDLWPVWEQIRCPVLVLRGAESDVLLPETAARMRTTGPGAEVVEFAGIGHAPALMAADQIDVVARWLLAGR